MRPLVLYLNEKNRTFWSVVVYAAIAGSYLYTNHNPIRTPMQLPFMSLDFIVPFVPATVWIYMSDYILFFFAFFPLKDMERCNRFLYGIVFIQLVSLVFFIGWPTTYPRTGFPLPEGMDYYTAFAFNWLRVTDSPNNCFPSLHVSSAVFSALLLYGVSWPRFLFFAGWALAIAVSTLTTKQHYAADVIGGTALAVAAYIIFFRWLPVRARGEAFDKGSGLQANR